MNAKEFSLRWVECVDEWMERGCDDGGCDGGDDGDGGDGVDG